MITTNEALTNIIFRTFAHSSFSDVKKKIFYFSKKTY